MSHHYRRNQAIANRRKSTAFPVFVREQEELENARRLSTSINAQRRYSTVSQLFLPRGLEYHPQPHVPPSGPEAPQTFFLPDDETTEPPRRVSVISQVYRQAEEELDQQENEEKRSTKASRILLFILEPILSGLILFPILVLFWECGWNLVLIILNRLNGFPNDLFLGEINQEDFGPYTWQSLVYPYLIAEFLLLLLYLGQDLIYNLLYNQNWLVKTILLKFHILLLASIYIVQWETLWTIWDQFTPHEWYFEFTLSIGAVFALIVFIGHISDLVCSPFIYSYDSIEYCVHIGCPLLTREIKQWKIYLINFVLYEIIISNLSIIAWRGFYHYLDSYLYPDDLDKSAGICLAIGYLLYFPLMYFQTYLEELNMKYEFWTFVSINFPQFYRNIRHLLAFLSSVFAWRGFWLLFDNYLYIAEEHYKAFLIFYLVSFLVLSFLQTASSTNGPLSSMPDENEFFPLYPHCYISKVQQNLSQLSIFQSTPDAEDTKL